MPRAYVSEDAKYLILQIGDFYLNFSSKVANLATFHYWRLLTFVLENGSLGIFKQPI